MLSYSNKDYIEELKDVVYDADDLFDRFATLVKQKQLIKGGKVSKKVRAFVSRYNPLGIAYKMSQGAKKVRNKLDAIASNHSQFGFSINPQPMRLRRDETCSYVYETNIVGRDADVENMFRHLLCDSDPQHGASFLSIVGIGGLGETALARLVYNDARVKQDDAFPLRVWCCVADHDQQQFGLVQILCKILNSATGENYEGSTLQYLQTQVVERITSEKYLLVLDDVWTEDRNQWFNLAEFFLGGQVRGSWILVTTHSHESAKIIVNGPKYELQGLSEEKSQCLFQKIAFDSEQSATADEDLVEIGQKIVQGFAGVPLAIRVAGSLLYGQDRSKWFSFQKTGLSNFKESQRGIKHILKFSYHQLESPLKICFTYCALFPKDSEIKKEYLLSLWMAQGYVVPVNGQTVEDAAEEYFSILLRRCFFQDIQREELFDIVTSIKLHDLMHDIALDVAGKEIFVGKFPSNINMDKKVHHVGCSLENFTGYSFTKSKIRSYCYIGKKVFRPRMELSTLEALFSNWVCLRALDLETTYMISLPESVGELLHLRYLDISSNSQLQELPKSIKKLCNLQTIKIGGCPRLKELPKDFMKSVNYSLRILEISSCGIEYLTCLGTLPHVKFLRLVDLLELKYILIASEEDGCLSLSSLERLSLYMIPNLKGWRDSRVGMADISSNNIMTTILFPQLKTLEFYCCEEMKCNLVCPKLENLSLSDFNEDLQVTEMRRGIGDRQREASSSSTTNFSSLFSCGVPKLRIVMISNVRWLNRMPMESFQCLIRLTIMQDTKVESLGDVGGVLCSCSSSLKTLAIQWCSKLRRVMSGGLEHLTCLAELLINSCHNLRLSEGEEEQDLNNLTLLPKLETLKIVDCFELKAIPEWMPKLTSLKELIILDCSEELKERCQNPNGED